MSEEQQLSLADRLWRRLGPTLFRLLPDLLWMNGITIAVGLVFLHLGLARTDGLLQSIGVFLSGIGTVCLGYTLYMEVLRQRQEARWLIRFSQRVRDYAVENIEPLRTSLDALKDVPDEKPPEKVEQQSSSLEDKPLGTKERNTYLILIAALCAELKIDTTRAAKSANIIKDVANRNGLAIGESTIEGILKKLPDAVAARSSIG